MSNNTNSFIMNNPMRKMKSVRLKRDKGSRYLIPKTRFSNNVEERYIPYDKDDNYKLPANYFSGRKGFRSKYRKSINVNNTDMRYMPSELNMNAVSKYRRNTLRKLKNKNNYFFNGGVNKTNPLIEKKLQNLYNKRTNFVKSMHVGNRKNMTKLDMVNLKIKEYVKNGYRGLRGSTRKLMNKLNND